MTFLELAQEIDTATALHETLQQEVSYAEGSVEILKREQAVALEALQEVVIAHKEQLKAAAAAVNALHSQMQNRMGAFGSSPRPVVDEPQEPTSAELKAIILEGNKLRGWKK